MYKIINEYEPSTYHDPREVIVKHLVAQFYWNTIKELSELNILTKEIDNKRLDFIKNFNSYHNPHKILYLVQKLSEFIINNIQTNFDNKDLLKRLTEGHQELQMKCNNLLEILSDIKHVDLTQGYVSDGVIDIANMSMIDYANINDFFKACLKLIGNEKEKFLIVARNKWLEGFTIDSAEEKIIKQMISSTDSATNFITSLMSYEQEKNDYKSIQEYEYDPFKSNQENTYRRKLVIGEGFYLMGRIMCGVSLMNKNYSICDNFSDNYCPISAFLTQSGFNLNIYQQNIIKKIMLIRATHGLSPGEFAARIAGSVRLSFPRALINSFIVRTGKTHGGALSYCMNIQSDYLKQENKEEYISKIFKRGNVSGFGHRIHKVKNNYDIGSDPRVKFMIYNIEKCFPEKKDMISELLDLAKKINNIKPNLKPNTDYVAGILFHCLDLKSENGLAIFTIGRLPGLISEIIRQLDYKSNTLRPPLPVVLPYKNIYNNEYDL